MCGLIFKGIYYIKFMLASFVKIKEVFFLYFSFPFFFVWISFFLVLSVTSRITKSPRGPGASPFFFLFVFLTCFLFLYFFTFCFVFLFAFYFFFPSYKKKEKPKNIGKIEMKEERKKKDQESINENLKKKKRRRAWTPGRLMHTKVGVRPF